MAYSDTAVFNLSYNLVVEEAMSRVGGAEMTGYEARAAKRAVNLALLDLTNRKVPLSAVERRVVTLIQGTNWYNLPTDTINVKYCITRKLEGTTRYTATLTDPFTTTSGSAVVTVTDANHGALSGDWVTFSNATAVGGLTIDGQVTVTEVISANAYTITWTSSATSTATGGGTVTAVYAATTDLTMQRIALDDYSTITRKSDPGLPFQWYLDRQITPRLYMYPTPDGVSANQVVTYVERKIDDIASFSNEIELPTRFLPAMCSAVAWRMSMQRPQIDQPRRMELKADFEQEIMRALNADRDPSPLRMISDVSSYYRI